MASGRPKPARQPAAKKRRATVKKETAKYFDWLGRPITKAQWLKQNK